MTTKTPQKRPLLLLHKCPECTTFALAPLASIKYQPQRSAASVQQRFSRLRLSSAPPTIAEHVELNSSLDDSSVFEEDEAEVEPPQQPTKAQADDGGSSSSGHSSLEDSPVSRSDSPSPTGETKTADVDVGKEKEFSAGRMTKALRHRSVSECEGIATSPIKGILKRPIIVRSLSECANESMMEGASTDCLFPNDPYVSESDDGDSDQQQPQDTNSLGNDQSSSFKKTVRFNDLVQQALFRPNSSILGHKKRLERKQQQHHAKMKRKRTNSNSISASETDPDPMGDDPAQKARPIPFTTGDQRRHHQKRAMEGNGRYAGFLIGHRPINSDHHKRHLSGDSALGDDEGDCEAGDGAQEGDIAVAQPEVNAARIQTSDTKDSGIDEEL